jgi:hypothetical protein
MIGFEKSCMMKAAFRALKLRGFFYSICATSIGVLVSREIPGGALNASAFKTH